MMEVESIVGQYYFTNIDGIFISQRDFKEIPTTPLKPKELDPRFWKNGKPKPDYVLNLERIGLTGLEYVEEYEGLNLGDELVRLRSQTIEFFRPFLTEKNIADLIEVSTRVQFITRPKPVTLLEIWRYNSWASLDFQFKKKDDVVIGNELIISLNRGVVEAVKEDPPEDMTPEEAGQTVIRECIAHELGHLLLTIAREIPFGDQSKPECEQLIENYANVIVHGQVKSPFDHFVKILKDEYDKIEKL